MATPGQTSKDEVDFVKNSINNNNNNNNNDCYKNNLNQHIRQNKVPKSPFNEKVPNFLINNNNNNHNNNNNNINNNNNNNTPIYNSNNNITVNSNDGSANKYDAKSKERFTLLGFGRKLLHRTNEDILDKKDTSLTKKSIKVAGVNVTSDIIKENLKHKFLENGYPAANCYANNANNQMAITANTANTANTADKYVKKSSLTRLLAKKTDDKKVQQKALNDCKYNTYGGRRRSGIGLQQLDRFRRYAKEEGDPSAKPIEIKHITKDFDQECTNIEQNKQHKINDANSFEDLLALQHYHDPCNVDLGTKAMRSVSRSIAKLLWRRTHSVDISLPDPEYKVSYLGNVLTGWAKGEGCVEKQLNTLWRNYTQNNKPDVIMRIKVCASGLKATTRQHGLTEYWANRITHCCAPKNYPRIFCWIYRHEGRKLKHELRCHAVLCSKEKIVQELCDTLKANLERALREFKREKILKQNARLSLANAVYDYPSLPRRKILLSVGSNNYRPPLERSKSAPKLMAIEEVIGEEGDDMEETNEPEMKSCCQKDSLYPAMTLGRRHCRRGHSIRRTGKVRLLGCANLHKVPSETSNCQTSNGIIGLISEKHEVNEQVQESEANSYGSDDLDDFENILKRNDYDTTTSLATELLPYFERQLHKQTSSSCSSLTELTKNSLVEEDDDEKHEPLSLIPTINDDPNARPENDFCNVELITEKQKNQQLTNIMINMRRSGVCSDGEEDYCSQAEEEEEDTNDLYLRQEAILNMLHRHSMRRMTHLPLSAERDNNELEPSVNRNNHQVQSSLSSENSSIGESVVGPIAAPRQQVNKLADSADDGSISSGCETSSTATNNQDDLTIKYVNTLMAENSLYKNGAEDTITTIEHFDSLPDCSRRKSSDGGHTISCSRSSSITLKLSQSSNNSVNESEIEQSPLEITTSININSDQNKIRVLHMRHDESNISVSACDSDSSSEYSDESGYVEYQEKKEMSKTLVNGNLNIKPNGNALSKTKPIVPPKPMPRRSLSLQIGPGTTTVV